MKAIIRTEVLTAAVKSWVEISATKLAGNLRAVQEIAGADVEVLAVIKADGYGHGAELCAPVLAETGARWLGVTDLEEGLAVRAVLQDPDTRLLVMCGMEPGDSPAMLEHDLTPVVWTARQIGALQTAAVAAEKRVRVHVEVDTGMSRQGVRPGEDLARLLSELTTSSRVVCEGVMTHFCCAEEKGAEITIRQRERFLSALEQVRGIGMEPELVHLCNTSAVDEGSTLDWMNALPALPGRAMVRAGFAIYGHALPLQGAPERHPALQPALQPVLTWKTRIIGIRDLQPGDSVGYGATFTAPEAMRLALLPVGYADGFRRAASSGMGDGWVMVRGKQAPVVGRVSMNLTTVDVTAIDDVREGDEVLLLGEGVSAEDHAAWSGTIAYDVLCGIRAHRILA